MPKTTNKKRLLAKLRDELARSVLARNIEEQRQDIPYGQLHDAKVRELHSLIWELERDE